MAARCGSVGRGRTGTSVRFRGGLLLGAEMKRTIKINRALRQAVFFSSVILVSACSTLPQNLISAPNVELSDVKVVGLDFANQSFLLSFDVDNPNAFALPVKNVGYGVKLDGQRFASGETSSNFTVPANGTTQFAITVDLNLLQTAPQLLSIVRDAARDEIPYELEGEFGVNLPFAPPVRYATNGMIQLSGGSR